MTVEDEEPLDNLPHSYTTYIIDSFSSYLAQFDVQYEIDGLGECEKGP